MYTSTLFSALKCSIIYLIRVKESQNSLYLKNSGQLLKIYVIKIELRGSLS